MSAGDKAAEALVEAALTINVVTHGIDGSTRSETMTFAELRRRWFGDEVDKRLRALRKASPALRKDLLLEIRPRPGVETEACVVPYRDQPCCATCGQSLRAGGSEPRPSWRQIVGAVDPLVLFFSAFTSSVFAIIAGGIALADRMGGLPNPLHVRLLSAFVSAVLAVVAIISFRSFPKAP